MVPISFNQIGVNCKDQKKHALYSNLLVYFFSYSGQSNFLPASLSFNMYYTLLILRLLIKIYLDINV